MKNIKNHPWLMENGKPHPAAMKLVKFMNATYKSYLDADLPTSMWNQPAASYVGHDGNVVTKSIGDVINSTHTRQRANYKWRDGWFTKAPKMPEELGTIFSEIGRKALVRHYFTNFNEYHFEELRSNEELIPIKGLGSKSIDSSRNYSINLEHQFEYFLKSAIMKKHMSQAYAMGQAIRYRINAEDQLGANGKTQLPELDRWLELQMEKLLRNRITDLPPIFSRALPFIFRNTHGVEGDKDEGLNFDLRRTLQTMGGLTAKIVLGGKIFGGLKNLIFIDMYGVKEAVKNDILVSMGKSAKFAGIQNLGAFANFDLTGLAKGSIQYFGIAKDAAQGNINKNKLWILLNNSAFLPTISAFRSDERLMTTGKDTLLSADTMFLPYSASEEHFVSMVFYAMLDNMKIDKPGHEFHGKSVYDMYEKYDAVDENTGQTYTNYKWRDDPKTGKPFIRSIIIDEAGNKVELTELNQKELSYMYTLYEKMQGGYHPMQRTIMETSTFGQMFGMFHRYLPSIMRNMFASKGANYSEGVYLLKGRNEDGTPLVE